VSNLALRDQLGAALGFEQATNGPWWGDCPHCGTERACVGAMGFSCMGCGRMASLEEYSVWPAAPDVPGTSEPASLPLDVLPEVLKAAATTLAASTQAPLALPLG